MYLNSKHSNPKYLANFFKSIENIINHCNLLFNSKGIIIKTITYDKTSLIDCFINKNQFEYFNCKENFKCALNLKNLCKILNTSESNDIIKFKINSLETLDIYLENSLRKTHYQIQLLDLNLDDDIDIPVYNYKINIDFSVNKFIKLINDLQIFKPDNITFKANAKSNKIYIITNSDDGNTKCELKNYTEKKKFKITNLDKTIINVNKCIINTFQESLELKFSINCIKNIFKISKLTNNMNIAISNNYPLKFEFNLNRFDYIKYYIAPKISDF